MPFEFKLPDLGEGVHEGEIVKWLVHEGDSVSPEQPLVEVLTDKVTADLPAPVGGKVLRLVGSPGDVVPVGAVLVTIDTGTDGAAQNGTEAAREAAQVAVEMPAAETVPPGDGGKSKIPLAVPAVRRLARELHVDLAVVTATGPGGRITAGDVRAAAQAAEAPARHAAPPSEASPEGVRRVPLRGLRRLIAEHMLDAQRNTAPYTLVEEVDFTELVGLRARLQSLAQKAGVRITYLPFVLAATGMALKEHPHLNATVDPATGDLLVHEAQHIATAVHTDEGLLVPVIRNVDRLKLLDLAREIERLSADARAGRLSREDVQGGTFTVTNLGTVGGLMGTPVLNTPQVAILGIHRIAPRPVAQGNDVVVRQMGNVSLTLDHRYVDGRVGAAFAQTLKGYLEDPAVMLFWLAEFRE